MGLDAYVPCHCWRDGATTPPPVDPALIQPDEETGFLDLDVPIEGNQELHHRFDQWMARGACPHEEMELITERIANGWGMGRLRAALDGAGGRACSRPWSTGSLRRTAAGSRTRKPRPCWRS